MAEQKQATARPATAAESPESTGADLRNPELDESVRDVLDEIDCCLAEAENEREAGQRRAAQQEYEEIQAAHRDCEDREIRSYDHGSCAHIRQMRAWTARYAHLFEWCCGVPDFDD